MFDAPAASDQSASVASHKAPFLRLVSVGQQFRYAQRRLHNALALGAGDALALGAALLIAGGLRDLWMGTPHLPAWGWMLLPVWTAGSFLMRLLPSWGLGIAEELRRITLLNVIVYAGIAVVLFVSKQGEAVSRLTLTSAFAISLLLVPYVRLWVRRLLIRHKRWGLPAVVYGAGPTGAMVVRLLQAEQSIGFHPIALLDDDPAYQGKQIEGVPVRGRTNLHIAQASAAILAMPHVSRTRLIDLLEGPLASYRTVLLIPDLFEIPSLWVKPRDLNGVLGIEIPSNLTSPMARFTKRATDLFLVLASAPAWGLLCVVIAALIYVEDRRSPFFVQERVGEDGRSFRTWKFRTMFSDAEAMLQRALDTDDALRHEWETTYKLKHDPRVTVIGGLLRRFSLDELPQLANVLRGEMSLVGPRPLPPYHHQVLPERVRDLRERVRPGLTGLWQISGRSDAGTDGMKIWDAYYVRNWSLWLDAVVLFRTARAVLKGTGAY